jgi:hypothetical protein
VDLSVLIPWRSDKGQRERVLRSFMPQWRQTGAQICIGLDSGEGPFNCAQALNNAYRQATSENLVMFGADCVPDREILDEAVRRLKTGEPWFPLGDSVGYYSEANSARIMSGEPYHDFAYEDTVPFCTGVLAVSRSAMKVTGGVDERFIGWGMEDAAFRRVLMNMYGDRPAIPLKVRCLWHETSTRGRTSTSNWDLIREYELLTGYVDTNGYLERRGSFL